MRVQHKKSLLLFLGFLSVALVLFGFKLFFISHFGSATPFIDQWDGEAANLYSPFLKGTLTLNDLIAPHNEHRILMTRLLDLSLLQLNGLWNPLLEMIANALLHVGIILMILAMIIKVIAKSASRHLDKSLLLPGLFLFTLCLFSPGYGQENTLLGFNTHFYSVILFSTLSVFCCTQNEPLSLIWCLGAVTGIVAFFSFASGSFAFAAVGCVIGIQYVLGISRSWKQVIGALVLALLFFIMLLATPVITRHAPFKAHSVMEFLHAFIDAMSWPFSGSLPAALIRNAPLIMFCVAILKMKPQLKDPGWFLLGVILWSLAQTASVAYGRASFCRTSRYLDLFAILIFINAACFFYGDFSLSKWKTKMALSWMIIIILFIFSYHTAKEWDMGARSEQAKAQTINVNNYQRSHDIQDLMNKKEFEIPYPHPDRLALILSDPMIQKILPATIHKPLEDGSIVKGRCDGVVNWLLKYYWILIGLGILSGFGTVILAITSQKKIGHLA